MDKLNGRKTLQVAGILDEFEKDRIKDQVNIASLFQSFGISLTQKGSRFMGLCPWHEDHTPSLSVDLDKGLYNCFGCGEAGDAFTLVQKMKGTDFPGALTYLKSQVGKLPVPTPETKAPPAKSVEPIAIDPALMGDIAEAYAYNLTKSQVAQDYLKQRGLLAWKVLKEVKAGFSTGELSKQLSDEQKEQAIALGILTEGGHEVFKDYFVIPLCNNTNEVVQFYGRRITATEPLHRYQKGTHQGLVNYQALSVYRDGIILTESVLDALSLMVLGFQNVVPCYGVHGFTPVHEKAFQEAAVKQVIIAFDADEAGTKGTEALIETLVAQGYTVSIISPNLGKDWNDALLQGATHDDIVSLIEKATKVSPEVVPPSWQLDPKASCYTLDDEGLSYRVSGTFDGKGIHTRLAVRIAQGESQYIDYLDLYSARSRKVFKDQASLALGVEAARIERELLSLLDTLSKPKVAKSGQPLYVMTPLDKEIGMSFLKNPNLLDEIIKDTEAVGYVGESTNKLLTYIAASSRKLPDPISIIVMSQSSAGKSYLIETISSLMPAEDVVNLTSLSDQALNYMSDGALAHKLLNLGEAVHNDTILHQIREMLSSKELSRMVVAKDAETGKLQSKIVRQEAIVSLMMSTTNHELNAENASRCFLIHADESEAQTRRIHAEQNKTYTLTRMKRKQEDIPRIVHKHQVAQRLLQPIVIINPFADERTFPSSFLRSRRDNKQLNDLVAAVCFLRQFQKEQKSFEGTPYIECDEIDVETAWNLFTEGVMRSTYLDMPESLIRLYEDIRGLCQALAREGKVSSTEVRFSQAQVRQTVRWVGNESIKKYLRKLVSLEYLQIAGGYQRGQRVQYQLVADESVEALSGFMPERLKHNSMSGEAGISG